MRGIRVHDALEWLFTFGWNPRSRCPGIRMKRRVSRRRQPPTRHDDIHVRGCHPQADGQNFVYPTIAGELMEVVE